MTGPPGTQRRRPARLPLVALPLLLLLPAGLGACLHNPPATEMPRTRIVWPPPPAPPRIEFLGSFRTPPDLGIRHAWLTRFLRRLVGVRRPTEMIRPYGIAVGPGGLIVLADPEARCVHLYDQARSHYDRLTKADRRPLVSPVGVAVDSLGRIYVTDSFRRAVFRYRPDGKWLDTLGGDDGLVRPSGLAFDARRDRLYVVDTGGHRIAVYDTGGTRLLTYGRRGRGPGEFNYPVAAAVDRAGNLYVTDAMNFRVQILDPAGRFLGSFGGPGNAPGDFDKAKGIALDPDGHIYVVEGLHDVIHVYDANGRLLTVLGGSGSAAGEFWLPTAIHIDAAGRILISDSANRRVQILRYLGEPGGGDAG